MFGFLKNLIRKPSEPQMENQQWPTPEQEQAPSEHAQGNPAPAPFVQSRRVPPPPRNGQQSRPVAAPGQRPGAVPEARSSGKVIELPLQPILAGLPLELQPRIVEQEVGDTVIAVSLDKVLSQLARGSVRISFGELRLAAPGVFAPEDDRDRVLVPLPLADVLDRLNPNLITRRRIQKRVEVPAEISSPFDLNDQTSIFSVGPNRTESAPPVAPTHAARQNGPSVTPSVPQRSSITSAPTPPPPSAAPPRTPAVMPAARNVPDLGGTPIPMPKAPATAAPTPLPTQRNGGPPPQAAPTPAPQLTPVATETEALTVSLIALAENWSEAVRKDIVHFNLVDAKVALPCDVVEQALKQGRLAFSWKTLRSWIKPAVLIPTSAQDNVVIELPLKVVAPLFLERQREANKDKQRVTIDEEIPNLFFGFPQADAPVENSGAAVTKPVETNYYVWDDSSDTVRVDASAEKRNSPGTRFVARYATPNEVVSRAAALDGVAGALIALPDGLMVASRLSADLNADTLAAFLPQIFAKVSQCTKELRMGELNNLNFTVGNVPWKIFRVNAIFFAALGRPGEPLPTAQLAALAAELDHKPK